MGSDTEGEAGWGHVPSLGRSTLRGARLSLAGFVLSRGMMLGAYVVLARLVSPTDFGHYAAASVITGVGTVFSESGMLSALIRRPGRIDEAASTAFFSLVISGTLLALGAPFLRISWGGTDARTLPAASTIRQVSQTLDSQFPVNSTTPIEALVTGARAGRPAELTAYLHRVDAIPGVTGAQVTGVNGGVARIDIGYRPATVSGAARHIVTQLRALTPPPTSPAPHVSLLARGSASSDPSDRPDSSYSSYSP